MSTNEPTEPNTVPWCSQCGHPVTHPACGPTHAVLWNEYQQAVMGLSDALKASLSERRTK